MDSCGLCGQSRNLGVTTVIHSFSDLLLSLSKIESEIKPNNTFSLLCLHLI